jgi:uncharacterized protein (TIGR00725 family)
VAAVVVAIVGPARASPEERDTARELGRLIARENWVLLTGGRAEGVMEAASQGAKEGGGTTVGILPSEEAEGVSRFIDIPILTGLGSARNNVNVLSSRVVFACGMGAGTASEVALAVKAGRPVVLVRPSPEARAFFLGLSPDLEIVDTPDQAVTSARRLLENP